MIKNNNLNLIPKSMGTTKIIKTFKGIDLIRELEKWVIFKKGMSSKKEKNDWTFNVPIGQEIKIVPTEGYTLNVEVFEDNVLVIGKVISSKEIFSREKEFRVKIFSEFDQVQIVEIYQLKDKDSISIDDEKLIYTNNGSSIYTLSVNNWSELNTGKNYKFTTDKSGNYSITANGSIKPLKNGDVIYFSSNCDVKFSNKDYNRYTINIYETDKEPTIRI